MTSPGFTPHRTTEQLYADLGEGITRGDESGHVLLAFLEAWGHLVGDVDDRVRATDEGAGWEQELDVDTTRSPAWLGQFVGVTIPAGTTLTRSRELVRERRAFRRGSPAALREAAQAHLTGTRRVDLYERDGGAAYQLRVITYTSETPDPSAVRAALEAEKPAGLVLTYEVLSAAPYDSLDATATTYDALDARATTYDALDRSG